MRKRKKEKEIRFYSPIEPWLYFLPFLLGLLIFTVYPVINVVLISFKENYRLLTGSFSQFSLENYQQVIQDPYFHNGLRNTVLYILVVVPIATAISLLFANLLNQKIKGIAFFHTAFFLPLVTSVTAVGLVWKLMFHTQTGVINWLLSSLGIAPVDWLLNPSMNLFALMIYGVWNMLPFTIILLLSGLQNIDPLYYTVAKVDGASSWKIFFRITLPLLAPTVGLTLIVNTISAAKVFNELFPLFTGRPGTAYTLYTLVYYIYEQFYVKWELGKAAAASLILFAMLLCFTRLEQWIQRKWNYY